jgi:hypothetical protein
MIGRFVLAPLLVLATLICGCSGIQSSSPSAPNIENTPQNESVWAVHNDFNANTSQLQGVFIANGSVAVSKPFEFAGVFVAGGTDPFSQLMFGELLSNGNLFIAHRQLLVFQYDGNSARQLSATEIPLPPGDHAGSIAVVPALKAIYLFSTVVGNENNDDPGHLLLFHYGQDGSIEGPIDVSPPFTRVPIFSNLAYAKKTSLLYGTSFDFAHTQPGRYSAFATVSRDGVPSSFTPFTFGEAGPPPGPVFCFGSGSVIPLAYTRDGAFGLTYYTGDNTVTVVSVAGGVANFASRTGQFNTDCARLVLLHGAALDEPHRAFYVVLQTIDPQLLTPVSAVLARFNFDPATGNVSPQPLQQVPIETTDHTFVPLTGSRLFVPLFGSRLFVFDGARLAAYTLTNNGPQDPQLVPIAFPPDLLFGDVPLL